MELNEQETKHPSQILLVLHRYSVAFVQVQFVFSANQTLADVTGIVRVLRRI